MLHAQQDTHQRISQWIAGIVVTMAVIAASVAFVAAGNAGETSATAPQPAVVP